MDVHQVAANSVGTIEIDLCHTCHAIWFDGNENLRMAPAGVVELFRQLHDHRDDAQGPIARSLSCPRCRRALAEGSDVVRAGRYIQDNIYLGVEAGAQIETCAAGRGILRQLVLHARVENLDINNHACGGSGSAICEG